MSSFSFRCGLEATSERGFDFGGLSRTWRPTSGLIFTGISTWITGDDSVETGRQSPQPPTVATRRSSPARSEPSDIGADGRKRVCGVPGRIGDVMPLVWPNAVQTVCHSASVAIESLVFHLSPDISEHGHRVDPDFDV